MDDLTAPLPELPGINAARGLALVGGKMASYLKLLKKFRDFRANDFDESFRQAQAAGDWATATRLAHTLKGVARTLGADRLGDLAERLEDSARQSQAESVAERLAVLGEELRRVREGLARLDEVETLPPPCPNPDRLDSIVRELGRLLEEQDTAAFDCVGQLEQTLAGSEHRGEAKAIGLAISRYAFKEAQERLIRLARTLNLTGDGNYPRESL